MSSRSRSGVPYQLYLRKKYEADKPARTLFIFCRSRKDPQVAQQKWIYVGLTYADWRDKVDNPLLQDTRDMIDPGFYGFVDAAQVETPGSELRKITDLSPADLAKFSTDWTAWFDAKVKERLAKGKGREGEMSKDEVEKDIKENEGRQWQVDYFKSLASDKIDQLTEKSLLKF